VVNKVQYYNAKNRTILTNESGSLPGRRRRVYWNIKVNEKLTDGQTMQ
jgi:hypothetical protein